MRFKIDCASLIVGRKFTVFALFYFVLSTSPKGAYSWRGDLTEGFCVTSLEYWGGGGLIFGAAYTWRSLFSEFYAISRMKNCIDLNRSEGFIYLPPFISRILDFIYCRVLILIFDSVTVNVTHTAVTGRESRHRG